MDTLTSGLRVVTANGDVLGLIQDVTPDRFRVVRSGLPDLWLASDAVSDVRGELAVLKPHDYEAGRWRVSPG
ncbi:MAG: hypothetical protein O2822_01125 [Chloroflexi bacterium]|nr:hypothetical protein [Chloroflexota bacterium]